MIRRQEENSGICLTRSFLLEGALCWNFKQGLNDGNPTCRATRNRLKNILDGEIKHYRSGGIGAHELEKYLIFSSNRLRTIEVARLEIVTCAEVTFGLTIRDSKPSESGVQLVSSFTSGTGQVVIKSTRFFQVRWSSSSERETAMFTSPTGKCNGKKCKQRKSWSKSANEAANKVMETEHPKDNPKVPRVPKVRRRVNIRKLVYLVLNTRNQRRVQKRRNLHRRITQRNPTLTSLC